MQTVHRPFRGEHLDTHNSGPVQPSIAIGSTTPSQKAPFSYFVESVLGFLLMTLSGFKFASASSTELDPSWQTALGYFLEKKLLAGVDYVFSYGPFGHFWSPNVAYYPRLAPWYFGWWLIFSTSLALFVVLGASRLPTRAQRIGFVGTLSLLCASFSYEVVYFTYICSGISLLFLPPRSLASGRRFATLLVGVVSALAFLSLTKLSVLLVAALGLTSICAYFCTQRRFALAGYTMLAYSASTLTLWLLAGQSLANIDDFVRASIEVALGYSPGMSLGVADFYGWGTALVVCSFALVLTAIKTWIADDKPLPLISGGFVVLTLLLAVKASFVRTFGIWFFGFAFCAPLFIHGTGLLAAKKRRIYLVAFALYEVTVVIGLFQLPPAIGQRYVVTAERIAAHWVYSLTSNVRGLLFLKDKMRDLDQSWNLAVQDASLPAVRKYVRNQSIDLFPNEPALLILNGLNYQPRPVFQSYKAYTESLQELNLGFYQSARAPRFVLFRSGTIDDRFPIGDDGRAIQYLLENYQPVLREDDYILLKRKKARADRTIAEKSLGVKAVPLNRTVEVPWVPDSSLRVHVTLKKTFFGQIFETLHALPHVIFEVKTESGNHVAGKLVPGIGKSGILLSPLLLTTEDWIDYFLGAAVSPAKQITIRLESPLGRWMYEDTAEVEYTLRSLTPPTIDAKVGKALAARYSKLFSPEPIALKTLGGRPKIMRLDGSRVLFLHAPSWIHLPLDARGTYRLHAEFGIMPGAESSADAALRTDGVVFSFRINDRSIAERELRPGERVEDRAPAAVTVEFHVTEPGMLVAEASVGAKANGNSDWSYWKRITVERIGD